LTADPKLQAVQMKIRDPEGAQQPGCGLARIFWRGVEREKCGSGGGAHGVTLL
jgi:hypothetical protein